jgi:hypothetical protein
MLAVIVRLEERLAGVKLEHDAADGPHITGLAPAKFYKLWNGLKNLNMRKRLINIPNISSKKLNL